MYEIEVQAEFAAAHAIVILGQREPIHGHNWHITATLAGESLDGEELLCDFHEVERVLHQIIDPWHNRNLNECAPFAGGQHDRPINPSAEAVARVVAERLSAGLGTATKARARVSSVRVTEAPGCAATYRPEVPIVLSANRDASPPLRPQ
jgi:6-pyruvoyltetrahydropterin/6-carboxytetrahydropterin synthase